MKFSQKLWAKPVRTLAPPGSKDAFVELNENDVQGEIATDWVRDTLIMKLPNKKWGAPIPISNWLVHSDFVGPLIEKLRPLIAVEVGVFTGGSLLCMRAWAKYYQVNTQFFGFDTWEFDTEYMEQNGEGNLMAVNVPGEAIYGLLKTRTRYYKNVHLFRQESQVGASMVPLMSVDLLHIDANHREEYVRRDLELWLPKMAAQSVVLLHDIGVVLTNCQVYKVWRDIQRDYPTFSDTRGAGLGAFCPRGVNPAVSHLFKQAVVV